MLSEVWDLTNAKAETATRRTFLLKNWIAKIFDLDDLIGPSIKSLPAIRNPRGFSLLEIMIVLGILSAVLVLGLPRLRLNQNNIKEVSRQMSVLAREIRNQARLKGATHRLVFNIPNQEEREARDTQDTYWVEFAVGEVLALTKAQMDDRERARQMDPETAPKDPFQKSDKFFKKEKEVPSNLRIGLVETSSMGDAVRSGKAYVYFSPTGLVDRTVIQITDGKNLTWTIVLNPLNGHAEIMEKAVRLSDLQSR